MAAWKAIAVGVVLRAPAVEHRASGRRRRRTRLFGRHDHARVHVHGRHVRVLRMRDQRDAGRPEARDRPRRRESARGTPARTRRCTVETCTPTFSKTRPCMIDMTPPPPGAPVWSVRCQGVRTKRPGRAIRERGARWQRHAPALRRPRRSRRAAPRTSAPRGASDRQEAPAAGRFRSCLTSRPVMINRLAQGLRRKKRSSPLPSFIGRNTVIRCNVEHPHRD